MAINWDEIDLSDEYDEHISDKVRTADVLPDIIAKVYSGDKADEYRNLLVDVLLEKQGALQKLDSILMATAKEMFTYKEFVEDKETKYWETIAEQQEDIGKYYD